MWYARRPIFSHAAFSSSFFFFAEAHLFGFALSGCMISVMSWLHASFVYPLCLFVVSATRTTPSGGKQVIPAPIDSERHRTQHKTGTKKGLRGKCPFRHRPLIGLHIGGRGDQTDLEHGVLSCGLLGTGPATYALSGDFYHSIYFLIHRAGPSAKQKIGWLGKTASTARLKDSWSIR